MSLGSPLGRFAHLNHEPDPAQARSAAAKAWHETGVLLCRPEWFNAWEDRKQAELLAQKLFGERRAGE